MLKAFLFLSLVPSIDSLFYMRTIAAHIVFVLSGGKQKWHEFDIMQDIWKNMTFAGRFMIYRKYCFEHVPSGRLAKFCRTSAVILVHTDFSCKSRKVPVFNLTCSRSVERCGAGTPNT